MKKLPDVAFATYVRMGESRSHRRIALEFGVTKRAVTKRARRERWAERLRAIEAASRAEEDREHARAIAESLVMLRRALIDFVPRFLESLEKRPCRTASERCQEARLVLAFARYLENLRP